tara:strand:- start:127 stop:483 length:357 start_codon:yes stop_codon:yes gene_type:complete
MAHFAKVEDGIVTDVIVVDNLDILDDDGNESEAVGIEFCVALFGGTWLQTSYSNSFRKNFAGVGYAYDSTRDAFIPIKSYPSSILDETTCQWNSPVEYPDDGNDYEWNEDTTSWDLIE